MITIKDVARQAGVSVSTVSNVLNHKGKANKATEKLVLDTVKELGYIPNLMAKGLKANQSNTIGILAENMNSLLTGKIIDGICEYTEVNGYIINLCNLGVNRIVPHPDEILYTDMEKSLNFQKSVEEAIKTLTSSHICGLIYLGTYPRNVENILPVLQIPLVYAYCYTPNSQNFSVCSNDFQGGKAATEYLISKGHTRIGVISGSINSYPTHRRMLGYQTALMEHHLPFLPDYICTGQWQYTDGYQQCIHLMNLPEPPTAIFSMSDVMAYGAMNAMHSLKKEIPVDCSIIGFDNLEMSAYSWPALTTVNLPLREIGKCSAKMIDDLLKGSEPEEHSVYLECTLVERDSVATYSE